MGYPVSERYLHFIYFKKEEIKLYAHQILACNECNCHLPVLRELMKEGWMLMQKWEVTGFSQRWTIQLPYQALSVCSHACKSYWLFLNVVRSLSYCLRLSFMHLPRSSEQTPIQQVPDVSLHSSPRLVYMDMIRYSHHGLLPFFLTAALWYHRYTKSVFLRVTCSALLYFSFGL